MENQNTQITNNEIISSVKELQISVEGLQGSVKGLQDSVKVLQDSNIQIFKLIKELSVQIANMDKRLTRVENRLDKVEKRLDNVETEVAKVRLCLENEIDVKLSALFDGYTSLSEYKDSILRIPEIVANNTGRVNILEIAFKQHIESPKAHESRGKAKKKKTVLFN